MLQKGILKKLLINLNCQQYNNKYIRGLGFKLLETKCESDS